MKKSTILKNRLSEPKAIVAPGIYDALSARICEMVGFEALQHSGYGTAAVQLGQPDVGLLTLTEMASQVRSISRTVNIPVVGDSDNGFGNAINACRAVEEYISAGAAGLFMEDQVSPKRCGHMEGKQVVSFEEMKGKLKAAMDVKNDLDPDFIIIYRTDAIAVHGYEDALDRAKRAIDLGVDMIFVEAMENMEQVERTARELKGTHLMLNLIEGGKTPLVPFKQAEEMGYNWIVPALTTLYSAAKGMYDVMSKVYSEGVSEDYMDKLISFREFTQVVRLDEIRKKENLYLPSEVLEDKYHGRDKIVETSE